jgi:hypothetical protein
MELVIEKTISWLVPFLCGTIVGGVTLWFVALRSLRDGVQCLLRAEIIRQNEKWTKVHYCPVYAKQALAREYKAYHALKGNDVATSLYEETMDLPERKEQK